MGLCQSCSDMCSMAVYAAKMLVIQCQWVTGPNPGSRLLEMSDGRSISKASAMGYLAHFNCASRRQLRSHQMPCLYAESIRELGFCWNSAGQIYPGVGDKLRQLLGTRSYVSWLWVLYMWQVYFENLSRVVLAYDVARVKLQDETLSQPI